MFYGAAAHIYRREAGYADRILRGANPGDLPVPTPNRFDFGPYLNTAKALGLAVPPGLLAIADEMIE